MAKYPQGTKGTIFLTIAGVADIVLSFVLFAFMFFTMVGAGFASRRLTAGLRRLLILNRDSIAGFGLRNIVAVALVVLFLGIIVVLFMAVMTLFYRKRDDGRRFLLISSGILLLLSVLLFVLTWSWIFLLSALIWLCTLVGALLAKFPLDPTRYMKEQELLQNASQFDSGLRR